MLTKDILNILACPLCKGPVQLQKEPKRGILCPSCKLLFPVENGYPILLEEYAYRAEDQE